MLRQASLLILLLTVPAALDAQAPMASVCTAPPESFALKHRDLPVWQLSGAVLFTAGMTIDADGAPNAYGPKNKGLDLTANARGAQGWAALVTSQKGAPVRQKKGPYRGFYISTTSLEQPDVPDIANPKRYIDARTISYIVLPRNFADRFGISLGDLAIVFNETTGRSAYAIFADIGPRGRIGEGSIALAKELGMPADPRSSQALGHITYMIFPGSAARGGKRITPARIRSTAAKLHRQWINESTFCLINPS